MNKKKIVINKDGIEKRIDIIEIDKYLQNGWNKGFSDSHKEQLKFIQVGAYTME